MLRKQVAKLDESFLKDRDRLDRGIYTEAQCVESSQDRQTHKNRLMARLEELKPKAFEAYLVEKYEALIPRQVGDFLEQVQELPLIRAKAVLQTFVKAIYVGKDAPLEI